MMQELNVYLFGLANPTLVPHFLICRKFLYSTFVHAALFSHSTMPPSATLSQWSDLLLS